MTYLYYCFQVVGDMNFIKRFLSCGCTEVNEKPVISQNSFCAKKRAKPSGDITVSAKCLTNSTQTNLQKVKKDISELKVSKRKVLPHMNFITCQDMRKEKDSEIDMEYLVGVINMNKKPGNLISGDSMVVPIGKKQEINSLSALRPGSLDCVLAFWDQQGSEFSKEELLILDQRLVLVFQQWDTLSTMLKSLEIGLIEVYGQFCLKQALKRLNCKVWKKQHYFLLEFQSEIVAQESIKTSIQNILEIELTNDRFCLLIDRITLDQYINLKKNNENQLRRVRYFLKEVQIEILNRRSKTLPSIISDKREEAKSSEVREVESEKAMLSSDVNEEEIKYFAQKMMESPSPQFDIRIDGDLDIFNYTFKDFPDFEESPSPRRINAASPSKTSRKNRTRSQQLSPAQTFECWDDQIFDKYK